MCLSPLLTLLSCVLAFLGGLPLNGGHRLIFYQVSDPSRWQEAFLGGSSPTRVLNFHVLSLGPICIPKAITEALLGLLQIQSQPLEPEGGISVV